MNTWNNWGPAAIIVVGYVIGLYFQNKRLDDVVSGINNRFNHIDDRFDDLYRYLDVRFADIERRLTALEKQAQ